MKLDKKLLDVAVEIAAFEGSGTEDERDTNAKLMSENPIIMTYIERNMEKGGGSMEAAGTMFHLGFEAGRKYRELEELEKAKTAVV